ncbi:Rhodanese-related sulfurtransferase [Candidatus Methanoperedens nitroreducens]|uniref:Rhodanese-related sulfurtransferase n=1 Tax=Candidatus Methanoperedens nitratireducens TaxID=1392998 RepID=A0A062V623_9EURY|nr:rhodanese-like domain-containing protein [Candidatus Methanoperedens nitroreducens]KCZ72772.1 Rhodanese-related sulfurtransferase [Candidatus Methanoperedens nitroreducens]MDJ1423298.1 rhodanese-like domain-containing protein [Candidatus Methanoperedens sp.]
MRKTYFIIALIFLLLATVSGCISTIQGNPKYVDITVQQAKEMIDRGEIFILDVRTQEEYDAGHIEDSTLIPVQVIDKRLDEIPKDKKILVYCRTGHRSVQASEILVNNGFKEVYNMKGGIIGWTDAGYEVVK